MLELEKEMASSDQKAVYPGTFDPPTLGHMNVLTQALALFDEVYVVVANNFQKQTLFSQAERLRLLQSCAQELKISFQVEVHKGLIVDYCRDRGIDFLIRGLRSYSDFENECRMALMTRRLCPQLKILHIMADEKFFNLSSSLIKELACYGERSLSDFLPRGVELELKKKMREFKVESQKV